MHFCKNVFLTALAVGISVHQVDAHEVSGPFNLEDSTTWPCGWAPFDEEEHAAWEAAVRALELKGVHDDAPRPKDFKVLVPDESVTIPGPPKLTGAISNTHNEPTGPLSGKIIYLMPGHGWEYSSGAWRTQRGISNTMVEDMGNLDQAFYFAQYAMNAGATIVPLRPVGYQRNQIVVDNLSASAVFTGSWTNSSGTPYYGPVGAAANYRSAAVTTGAPTATARFNANFTTPGFYPVYVWALGGDNRIKQQYLVGHSGGVAARRVDHKMVGAGWIYLGTFHFEGTGYVEITNNSLAGETGAAVIADAVRFGNGMGSYNPGGGISGKPREEEHGGYWAQESVGTSAPAITTGSVEAPPRLARYMNREGVGSRNDRIYLSFHSNASGNTAARGAYGLYNSNTTSTTTVNSNTTTNGFRLAQLTGEYTNKKMTAVTGAAGTPFSGGWGRTGNTASQNTYGSGSSGFSAFGEISVGNTNNEFAATIIEVGFHTSPTDAVIMRHPQGRNALAIANYMAVVHFFNEFAGSAQTFLPDAPKAPRVTSDNSGNLTLAWTNPVANAPYNIGLGAPTGLTIYISENGYGFTPLTTLGTPLPISLNVTANVPLGEARYFRIAATNAGGESMPSETVAVRRAANKAPILIVSGFDRNDSTHALKQTETLPAGTFDRVVPRYINSFDYSVPIGRAVDSVSDYAFDTCQNTNVRAGTVNLTDYKAVFWILGEQSTVGRTLTTTDQTAISTFLAGGGRFFVSGAEIGWDIGRSGFSSAGDIGFFNNTLKTTYVADSAGTYTVAPQAGGIYAGIANLAYDNGTNGNYNARFVDRLGATAGGQIAMTYVGGSAGNAAISWNGEANGKTVVLGFPYETITSKVARDNVMLKTLQFFDIQVPTSINTAWFIY